jgi:4-amino-4-deoxy-L-arabinose transferase-like glycosyltransferase
VTPLRRSILIALLALAVVPFFVGLGASTIWDANEAFYVETPREMIESGDYVNPSFNYEPRFNKPVLSYWIVAALYHLFGVSVAVERLAIAGAAMTMIVAAWFLGRAASSQPLAAPLAALGLAVGPRFFMFSRRILVDMAITAAMTLTLLFFALAERHPGRRRLFLALMYVSAGIGVLTKGPVAVVIPALVFIAYLAAHRELGRLREMMIPAGALIVLAIAAPWYLALYREHGWTHITAFFIGENVGRFTETIGVQARGPLFYVPVLFGDSLPWSVFLPAAIVAWWRDRQSGTDAGAARVRSLLLLWVAVIVVFFSASQTKQDLYIFPVVAAVAALGADAIARAFAVGRGMGEGWLKWTLTVLGILMALAGAVVLYLFGWGTPLLQIEGAYAIALVTVIGGAVTAIVPWLRRHAVSITTALGVFIAFNWILTVAVLPAFEQYKPSLPLSRVIEQKAGPSDAVVQVELALPSMVYYLRRHVDVSIDRDSFLQQLGSGRTVYAVIPDDVYDAMKPALPAPTCIVGRHPTTDMRLRNMLERRPPPEVFVVSNRCPPV